MALPKGGEREAGSFSFAIFVLLITATKQKITEAERRRARGTAGVSGHAGSGANLGWEVMASNI